MTQPQAGWLDLEPTAEVAPRKRTRKSKKTRQAKKRKAEQKILIESSTKLPNEVARRFREGRIWGCDGEFILFRPKRMIEGVWTQVANPVAMERHERHLRMGHYVYLGTQGDVQIYRVTEKSPLKRKFGSLMEMNVGQLKRAVIMSAVKREWPVYVDALEELAFRIKSGAGQQISDGKGAGQLHALQWNEMLVYINQMIEMRRGPTPEECGREMSRIMSLRRGGDGVERRILVGA